MRHKFKNIELSCTFYLIHDKNHQMDGHSIARLHEYRSFLDRNDEAVQDVIARANLSYNEALDSYRHAVFALKRGAHRSVYRQKQLPRKQSVRGESVSSSKHDCRVVDQYEVKHSTYQRKNDDIGDNYQLGSKTNDDEPSISDHCHVHPQTNHVKLHQSKQHQRSRGKSKDISDHNLSTILDNLDVKPLAQKLGLSKQYKLTSKDNPTVEDMQNNFNEKDIGVQQRSSSINLKEELDNSQQANTLQLSSMNYNHANINVTSTCIPKCQLNTDTNLKMATVGVNTSPKSKEQTNDLLQKPRSINQDRSITIKKKDELFAACHSREPLSRRLQNHQHSYKSKAVIGIQTFWRGWYVRKRKVAAISATANALLRIIEAKSSTLKYDQHDCWKLWKKYTLRRVRMRCRLSLRLNGKTEISGTKKSVPIATVRQSFYKQLTLPFDRRAAKEWGGLNEISNRFFRRRKKALAFTHWIVFASRSYNGY